MQKQPSERFFKNVLMTNFPELTKKKKKKKKYVPECTFFAEHCRTPTSDCSSIISSEGRTGKQNRKSLERAVQVKEQVSEAVVPRLQIRCS